MNKKYFMRKCDECDLSPSIDNSMCSLCLIAMAESAAISYKIAYNARLNEKLRQYSETPKGEWSSIFWMGS